MSREPSPALLALQKRSNDVLVALLGRGHSEFAPDAGPGLVRLFEASAYALLGARFRRLPREEAVCGSVVALKIPSLWSRTSGVRVPHSLGCLGGAHGIIIIELGYLYGNGGDQ